MNVRVTSLTTNYNHTIPMNAGRELEEEGRTVHLSSLDVECTVEESSNGNGRNRTQFEFHWAVDQEANGIELATVETPHDESAPVDRLQLAAELADDIVHEYMADVGIDMAMTNPITSPGVTGCANVFTDLKVTKDV